LDTFSIRFQADYIGLAARERTVEEHPGNFRRCQR
jgi:hypothetical protein